MFYQGIYPGPCLVEDMLFVLAARGGTEGALRSPHPHFQSAASAASEGSKNVSVDREQTSIFLDVMFEK